MRWQSVLLTGCSALVLASCGGEQQGGKQEDSPAPGPTIAAGVADPLADRSEKVAALLEAGNACEAKVEAVALRDELTAAINDDTIPHIYLEDLSASVNELEAQIPPCQKIEPPPIKPEDKGKDKDKDKDKDEGDD